MSSGVEHRSAVAALRAMAHPVRLRILSLLTGTAMSAAEVSRELGLTHANASYHLRLLAQTGHLVEAGEEAIRGGRAKRYRYDADRPVQTAPDTATAVQFYDALAAELVRRARLRRHGGGRATSSDAELWVPPEAWGRAVDAVSATVEDLHRMAVPIRSADAVHVSVTTALFELVEPGALADDRDRP
jgi:DNA-binding transcriptional ArsR family regulator